MLNNSRMPLRFPKRSAMGAALVALLGLVNGTALAAAPVEPITLQADHAELDNAKGVSVYTGDVVLTRGELRITGDVMHVYTNAERNLEKVVVEGEPATYRDLPEGETEYVKAEAPRMEYFASGPERVRLLDGAVLHQGQNEFRGETVTYDVAADRVNAESRKSGNDRIRVKIYPNAKSDAQGGGTQ
jgi:lipopolysaccharide export system protein LptA